MIISLLLSLLCVSLTVYSFSPPNRLHRTASFASSSYFGGVQNQLKRVDGRVFMSRSENTLIKIPDDDETAIPFVDTENPGFIECYADSVAVVNGMKYTIGSPCDNAVALCFFDDDDQLIPIELDEDLMDDVFPVAGSIVEEEFGEELSLERTPQTLTLMGELEEGEEDEEDEDEAEVDDNEEEVEILLTFEHKGIEYHLVRLLDPVLLVGKVDENDESRCMLLSPEESGQVMPILEQLFLKFAEE